MSVDDILWETNPYISFITKTLQPYIFTVCPRDQYGNLRNDDDPFYLSTEQFTGEAVLMSQRNINDIIYFNIDDTSNNNNFNMESDVEYGGSGARVVEAIVTYNYSTLCFDFSITPELAGTYLYTIYYEDRNLESGSETTRKIPVKDSPFEIFVLPSITYGPTSRIYDLPIQTPLLMTSGSCFDFVIETRDRYNNRVLHGGDNLIVYLYEVGTFPLPPAYIQGSLLFTAPTMAPVSVSAAPTTFTDLITQGIEILNDEYNPYNTKPSLNNNLQLPQIVYGDVHDKQNGNYTATICPIIAGVYEIHVLLNNNGVGGVSNQFSQKSIFTHTIYDRQNNRQVADMGGQYIDKSPYPLLVRHSAVYGPTTTAVGPGIVQGVAGIATYYFVTLRDSGGNIVSDDTFPYTITMSLDLSIKNNVVTTVQFYDLHNGTWLIEYIPIIAGQNQLSVLVNGFNISGSPFLVTILEGSPSPIFSHIINGGLGGSSIRSTIAGVPYYFEIERRDVEGNLQVLLNGTKPKITQFEYIANTPDGLNYTGSLTLCPSDSSNNPVGDGTVCLSDGIFNLYYGYFTPTVIGTSVIHIYLVTYINGTSTKSLSEIGSSPFTLLVTEGSAHAINTNVSG